MPQRRKRQSRKRRPSYGGPRVRIPLAPAESLRTFGSDVVFTRAGTNGKHDDQVNSTAQFLDWFKKPFPGQGIFEYYRRRAQELEEQRKPQPVKKVWAIGSRYLFML